MEIACVTVDCANPPLVAAFWNAALEWGGVLASPDGRGAVCGPADGGTYLEFIRVPEDKVVKNRVHLGLHLDTLDGLEPEIERLLALGATIAWEETFPPDVAENYRNLVLRDPEDNEFCLGAGTPPG